jgi:hypothetical protein
MNKFEKKRCKNISIFILSSTLYLIFLLVVTKLNDYQVSSGAKITCAKFGAQNYQLLAAGDD